MWNSFKEKKQKTKMKTTRFLLLFLIMLMPLYTAAHEIRPAYLQIIQVDEFTYEVYWKVPSMGDLAERLSWVSAERTKNDMVKNKADLFLRPPVNEFGELGR